MRPRTKLQKVLFAVALALFGLVGTVSTASLFAPLHTTLDASAIKLPTQTKTTVVPDAPSYGGKWSDCDNAPRKGPRYFANEPEARKDHEFGTSLDPKLTRVTYLDHPLPGKRVATETWDRLCQDPVLARTLMAVVDSRDPSIGSSQEKFDWPTALTLLDNYGSWKTSYLEYKDTPPEQYTMRMVTDGHSVPTTQIVTAHTAGWYLMVTFSNGNWSKTVALRVACGGQPALSRTTQEDLDRLFDTV